MGLDWDQLHRLLRLPCPRSFPSSLVNDFHLGVDPLLRLQRFQVLAVELLLLGGGALRGWLWVFRRST